VAKSIITTRESIATRLLALTFSIYFLVAMVITVGHMKFEYDQEKRNIIQDLNVFHTTFQPIMSQMVWSINHDALRATVEGIAAAPTIAGVRIMPNGMDEIAIGTIRNAKGQVVRAGQVDKPIFWDADDGLGVFDFEFPILYKTSDGRVENLGKGVFYSSNAIVLQRVQYGFVVIVANALIKTAALWIIFSWLSNRVLRRPLAKLNNAVLSVDFERLEHLEIDLGTRGRNELKALEEAFNGMIQKLRTARLELHEANHSLEQKVSERTGQLEASLRAEKAVSHELVERTSSLMEANRTLEKALHELRAAQTQLIQSEKMASLGHLVAGVAHELNTPIGNALVTATILESAAKELHDTVLRGELRKSTLLYYVTSNIPMVELITRSCERAADLISSFKQVAVDQTSEKRRVFDLRQLVDDNVTAVRPSFRRAAWVINNEIPDGIACDSHPGPMGQVVANLVQNAVLHGFEGRSSGTLTISGRREDDAVEMVFADDGQGMSNEVLKHIFEPFYTTRMGQGGSGLGMSIVLNIVTGMLGGTVHASSEPGSGTTITVRIPLCAPERAVKLIES
jgi:signal transduction histidine kinase